MPPPSLRRHLPHRAVTAAAAALVCALSAAATTSPSAAATGFQPTGQLTGLGSGKIWDVAISPAVPSTVLAATDTGVFVSRDSGATWRQTLTGSRTWTVGFDVRSPQTALAGTNGDGVYSSSDAGTTWAKSSTGLPNQDVRCFAFGLDGIAAGTGAGVALSPDGSTWHAGGLSTVSIAALAVATNAPQFTLIAGADNGSLGGGYLFRGGAGTAWTALQNGLPTGAVVSSLTAGPIDQAVPKRPVVVATNKGMYRSGDGGTIWTGSTGVPVSLTATSVRFSPLDPNLVYAGADAGGSTGGDLLRSTDGGQTFTASDAGLPAATKNVEAIGIGPTNPLTVDVALNPPTGPARVYTEVDASAPSPPQLTPEAPGAPVPKVIPTPSATATPAPEQSQAGPATAQPGAVQQLASTIFHWPFPLVYEIAVLLLAVYLLIRWRQHSYVEGPP